MNAAIEEIKKIKSEREWSDEAFIKLVIDWFSVSIPQYNDIISFLNLLLEREECGTNIVNDIFYMLEHHGFEIEIKDFIKSIDIASIANIDRNYIFKLNLGVRKQISLVEEEDFIITINKDNSYFSIYKNCNLQANYAFNSIQEIPVLIKALQKFMKLNLLK